MQSKHNPRFVISALRFDWKKTKNKKTRNKNNLNKKRWSCCFVAYSVFIWSKPTKPWKIRSALLVFATLTYPHFTWPDFRRYTLCPQSKRRDWELTNSTPVTLYTINIAKQTKTPEFTNGQVCVAESVRRNNSSHSATAFTARMQRSGNQSEKRVPQTSRFLSRGRIRREKIVPTLFLL